MIDKIKHNKISALLLRLLIIVVIYEICRLLFYVLNFSFFSELSKKELIVIFFYGLRFDISAILMVNTIYILLYLLPFRFIYHSVYQKALKIFFIIFNSVFLLSNVADIIYFRFTLKRTTADIFEFISTGSDFLKLLPQFIIDFWYIVVMFIVFVYIIIYLYDKISINIYKYKLIGFKFYIIELFVSVSFVIISIIGIRGGLQLKPLNIIKAGEYTDTKNAALILNTPFTILKTFGKEKLENITYFSDKKELFENFNPYHKYNSNDSLINIDKPNIVIIILESFSVEHSGFLNKSVDGGKYKGYTPFLDSLLQQGIYFNYAFANGKRSIEGIPAILSSIPTLMNTAYITSFYSGNKIESIASLLKSRGYKSAFYHGGTNGTMGFDSYIKMAGFDKYYGRTEYNNDKDFDGKWGIFDEEFLSFTAESLNKTQQPFVASVFTLSSHHPYKIPDKYKNKFVNGKLPIHKSIEYADYSLKKFFQKAEKMPWFKNTIFIITADHTSELIFPQYKTKTGVYRIPLLLYSKLGNFKGTNNIICQQADIMPTVMQLTHYNNEFFTFGSSLLDKRNHFAINYLDGYYQFIYNDYSLIYNGKKSLYLYDFKNDIFLKNNLIDTEIATKKEMENKLKALIQIYNKHMNENKLTINL